ncbi:hypothetical protein K490DRAFT_31253 [Saccharata proteae CBS 121410]|uniref:Protein ROT1 n=1 Tax=Saccharata proteae CBS 121410 TaxID=1314787 RepID=A0A9P4I149_9PEZI|nr:hypothetical protein K490DRAFT_31253 [Saccharata proteae CBS 121410]
MLVPTVLLAGAGLAVAQGILDSQLYGTWSSKSNKTLTGPGFYDPVADKMIEPTLPGISYSFTSDGYFEEAYYRALSNPTNPACPRGIMQWQHGTFVKSASGSLELTPISVDGRQLLSDPCNYDAGVYTRYNQSETFKRYEISTDAYHNILKLILYEYNGAPMQPLYLAYSPPEMLPTTTLNPTVSSTAGAKSTGGSKVKRAVSDEIGTPLKRTVLGTKPDRINADHWWWFGVAMTGVGGLLYICF